LAAAGCLLALAGGVAVGFGAGWLLEDDDVTAESSSCALPPRLWRNEEAEVAKSEDTSLPPACSIGGRMGFFGLL
jgi:hypothetical protein